ncbi:MAG: putative RDD family membrane protein YckC, partial [Saprospiraceae bacterium]
MNKTPSYVGFWSRFLAFLVDSLVASIIIYPLLLMFAEAVTMADLDFSNLEQTQAFLNRMLERLLLESLFISVVFVGFWIYLDSSPGKLL